MSNKKIWIDTSFYTQKKTGIGFYILTLMKCLENLKYNYSKVDINLPGHYKMKTVWLTIWMNTILFFRTCVEKPNIIIFPAFVMPFFKRKKTKYVTVIHDLCFFKPQWTNKKTAYIVGNSIKNTVKRADIIVVVSNTIKNELIEMFNLPPEKIMVIHNAVGDNIKNKEFKSNICEKLNLQKETYILSIATMNKHKNLNELIKGFEIINKTYKDLKLVLVGHSGNYDYSFLNRNENIIFTGYVKDEEIRELYKNALMYVFPSLYEGFGIPTIEAQYLGCPLICSDIPVMKEIARDGALYAKPDSEGLSEKIIELIQNEQTRKEFIEKGLENVKRFDISNVSQQLKNVIERCE